MPIAGDNLNSMESVDQIPNDDTMLKDNMEPQNEASAPSTVMMNCKFSGLLPFTSKRPQLSQVRVAVVPSASPFLKLKLSGDSPTLFGRARSLGCNPINSNARKYCMAGATPKSLGFLSNKRSPTEILLLTFISLAYELIKSPLKVVSKAMADKLKTTLADSATTPITMPSSYGNLLYSFVVLQLFTLWLLMAVFLIKMIRAGMTAGEVKQELKKQNKEQKQNEEQQKLQNEEQQNKSVDLQAAN